MDQVTQSECPVNDVVDAIGGTLVRCDYDNDYVPALDSDVCPNAFLWDKPSIKGTLTNALKATGWRGEPYELGGGDPNTYDVCPFHNKT